MQVLNKYIVPIDHIPINENLLREVRDTDIVWLLARLYLESVRGTNIIWQ